MAPKHGGWCVCGHEGALDACPKNVCACVPVGMYIKFLSPAGTGEKCYINALHYYYHYICL